MTTNRGVEHRSFACPKLDGTAVVAIGWIEDRQRGLPRVEVSFDCAHREKCGVGTLTSPGRWSYDWRLCVHPEAPR